MGHASHLFINGEDSGFHNNRAVYNYIKGSSTRGNQLMATQSSFNIQTLILRISVGSLSAILEVEGACGESTI
ncbi:hypothetical protein HanXRQr2_Chr06g0269371 [Helianthus annuus]|uniref:Uncharacterized protein n=1 Tax=Helianthus annuus TaxID=4232 RepID=A0A9K3IUD4_HELAN|nr:hypothetical protein HanXRQr2_Chr06g0269371 [Helianthus annuus]KAJ0567865.1 hypothetical protein HanIR_Chr06g0289691 [Helianthus annuus]KAJ0916293.1 hypothetical protein HanPSC8_Chr06g0259981 [Helianthus annuus]